MKGRKAWAADMQALNRQAAGMLEVWPVMAADMPGIIAEAFSGSAIGLRILEAITDAVEPIRDARHHSPLCGCCVQPLHGDCFSFVYAQPFDVPNPSRVLVLPVCEGCGLGRDEIRTAGVKALQSLWPEARAVTVHSAGGRA